MRKFHNTEKRIFTGAHRAFCALLALVLVLLLSSCMGELPLTQSFFAMNTLMQGSLYLPSSEQQEVFSLLEKTARELEALLSVNVKGSEVSRINESTGPVSVSPDTAKVVAGAVEACRMTDGAFNCTVCPVLRLWGFTDGNYRVPEEAAVREACKKVTDTLSVSGNTVDKGRSESIDLGGIAKGYLGDRLLEILNGKEISGVLSLGGNIVLAGDKPDGSLWTVEVRDPLDSQTIACTVALKGNRSVVTSGAYERFFTENGTTFHHILDPETGYPAKSDLLSVSVIGENGMLCDAFSTAAFVMGEKKAAAFFSEHSDFQYILITADRRILCSNNLRAVLEMPENSRYTLSLQ